VNADEAMRGITEVIRRKLLALAAERGYRNYLKMLTFHLPSEQKSERFLTALSETGCRRRQPKSRL